MSVRYGTTKRYPGSEAEAVLIVQAVARPIAIDAVDDEAKPEVTEVQPGEH